VGGVVFLVLPLREDFEVPVRSGTVGFPLLRELREFLCEGSQKR
jgi:hypothetical protein